MSRPRVASKPSPSARTARARGPLSHSCSRLASSSPPARSLASAGSESSQCSSDDSFAMRSSARAGATARAAPASGSRLNSGAACARHVGGREAAVPRVVRVERRGLVVPQAREEIGASTKRCTAARFGGDVSRERVIADRLRRALRDRQDFFLRFQVSAFSPLPPPPYARPDSAPVSYATSARRFRGARSRRSRQGDSAWIGALRI